MGFGDFVKNQFIDVIEYVDASFSKTLVVKYSRPGNEIKQGAQLIVRNGQAAVFVHRGQIADIFNDTTLDRRAIDDFYGDWMLSPSVKLKDVPFFTDRMKSELLEDGLITKNKGWSKNMWEQTVAEYIKDSLKTAPVAGDTVAINEEWLLVIKEVDDQGRLRTIGLKQLEGPAVA